MRYWYTVILIVLGVFILMALIIKICGKKTPLVRSRRKRRRPTIQHGTEHGHGIDQAEVQVHPTAVEASVPLGKKVRKGENRKKSKSRKVSKSQRTERSPSTATTSPTYNQQPGKDKYKIRYSLVLKSEKRYQILR